VYTIVNSPLHGLPVIMNASSPLRAALVVELPDRKGEGTRNVGQWPVRRRVSDLVL